MTTNYPPEHEHNPMAPYNQEDDFPETFDDELEDDITQDI